MCKSRCVTRPCFAETREREERKKREQRLQEERDKATEREHEEERRREEEEKALLAEKERREQEEYLKLKQAFSVEEEGFEDRSEDEPKNMFADLLDYVKCTKVVVLEDLAHHFGLNTTVIIDRVQRMLLDGILTGVIDDRGKFIYVSQQEFEAMAKFVKQRGRISIAELAEHSNDLINLKPKSKYGVVEA
jgi:ATP-dependent 26S proteasome regulatory subunit